MIGAIAFDFGGTLFSTAKMGSFTPSMIETFVERVTVDLKCTENQAEAIFGAYTNAWRSRRQRAGDLPELELSSADLLQVALHEFKFELPYAQQVELLNLFHRKEAEQFTPLPKVIDSLPILAARGYRLCVVSNNPWSESIRASLRRHNVDSLFEQVIVSCDVGFRKPHRRIFEELVRALDLPSSEVLFVGDSYTHDVETPMNMGMRTCLVDFEGTNKNGQRERANDADLFLTQFDDLISAVTTFA